MALGARLKQLRIRSGQSLQAVADAVDASKAHIWELESGRSRNPSLDLLTRLANHFKVPTAWLVGEDPNAEGEDPELIAMFRDLKNLEGEDRDLIRSMMQTLKDRRKKGSENDS